MDYLLTFTIVYNKPLPILTEPRKKMPMIKNKQQYEQAVKKVEELLPLVNHNTPIDDPNNIELEMLSNLVAGYSDKH